MEQPLHPRIYVYIYHIPLGNISICNSYPQSQCSRKYINRWIYSCSDVIKKIESQKAYGFISTIFCLTTPLPKGLFRGGAPPSQTLKNERKKWEMRGGGKGKRRKEGKTRTSVKSFQLRYFGSFNIKFRFRPSLKNFT